MYKYVIPNQSLYDTKQYLNYFIDRNRKGCKVELYPYNNLWCYVVIWVHPNYDYSVIRNYIKMHLKYNQCICSDKAKQFLN